MSQVIIMDLLLISNVILCKLIISLSNFFTWRSRGSNVGLARLRCGFHVLTGVSSTIKGPSSRYDHQQPRHISDNCAHRVALGSQSLHNPFTMLLFLRMTECISKNYLGLPWWRSGWESACQCRGHGFKPWSGKIPHAAEQLSPWATTTEPVRLELVLRNGRGRDSERPAHCNEEWPPLAATGESPRTETKTQHSQK